MEIFGIPLHPLVVHAAVIVVPLVAMGTLLIAFWPKARLRFGWLVAVFSLGGIGATVLARASGEELFESMGEEASPTLSSHMSWGNQAFWPAIVMAVALFAMMLTTRGRKSEERPSVWYWVSAVVAVLAAIVSLVMIIKVGHSGATAVWTE
jgi:glucan phosphoethanolaminetransferase (alkaline phosphatase superfamily)